jgi:hypothetical protein
MVARVVDRAEEGRAVAAETSVPRMTVSLGAVLLTALLALPAVAQHGPGGGPPAFEAFDLDGDGRIGEAEFYEARGQRIAERAAEGRPMKHLSEAPSFAEIDSDGDGAIEPAEFADHQARHRQSIRATDGAEVRE